MGEKMIKTRESGVKWLGRIPHKWNMIYGQYLYTIVTGKKDVNQGDVIGKYPFFTCSDEVKKINEYSFDCEALLVAGNGMVGNTKYYNGKFDAYQRTYVLYDFNKKLINVEFLKLYVENLLTMSVKAKTSGSVIDFIKIGDIKKFEIVFPTKNNQDKIAKFLNKRIKVIDELINKEKQQIEKLNDYKLLVITDAVTKGINKKTTFKESGVKLIGKVPQHWDVKKVKFMVETICKGNGIKKTDLRDDGNTLCIRYGEIYSKYNFKFENCISRTNKSLINKKVYIEYGDILCAGTGELVTEIGKNIVYLGKEKCLAGGDIIIIRHKQDPNFLSYALNSIYAQNQKSIGKFKLKVVHISASDIGNVFLALPPTNEQREITSYIDKKIDSINQVVELKLKKINKLVEYKRSLIYEYVTGKKEV